MNNKKILSGIRCLVYACSGIVLSYLLLTGILSTCFTGISENSGNHTFYVGDYPAVHVAAVAVLVAVICLVKNKAWFSGDYDRAVRLLIGTWGVLASLWVVCYADLPKNDQANVLLAVRQMRQYNFSSFTEDGYLGIWTGNQGLALFFYLLSFWVGVDNYTALRLLNVLAGMLIFLLVYKMVDGLWGRGKRMAFWTVFFCACFAPLFLYTTFIYGDIYGLCLTVVAVYAQLKYFEGRGHGWMLLSAAAIALAVLLKMNCLIVLVAMAAVSLYDVLLWKQWVRTLAYLALLAAVTAGVAVGSSVLVEHITRMEKREGVPTEAWVAMGLQEGARAFGNFNGYNLELYTGAGYDSGRAREEAVEDIRASLRRFQGEPGYAVEFFAKKTASQWNNPDFFILSNALEKKSGASRITNGIQAGWGRTLVRQAMNIMQTWIVLGTLCYIAMGKNRSDYEWIFLLVFLGGFVFHLFWEAGCRYAFPYYLMLIPYAGMGLSLLEEKVEDAVGDGRGAAPLRKCLAGGSCLLLLALLCLLPRTGVFDKVVIIAEEPEEKEPLYVADGFYTISPAGDGGLCLAEAEGGVRLADGESDGQTVSLFRMNMSHAVRFLPSQNTLELAGGEGVVAADPVNAFGWRLEPAGEDGGYYILMDDRTALTYSLEDWSVKLGEFAGGDEGQVWTLAKKGGWDFAR